MNTPAKPHARRATPTKAELEATVTQLRADLKEAQQKEETFADLRDSLKEAHKNEIINYTLQIKLKW